MGDTENINNTVDKKNSSKKRIILLIAVVFAVFVIGVVAIIVRSNSPEARVQKQLELAQRYLEELNYDRAIATFEAVIEIEPNNVEAYLGLAKAYEGTGDVRSSIKTYEDIENSLGVQLSEDNINSLITLYKQLCKQDIDSGEYDEAEEIALKILERNSSESETIGYLCDIYIYYAENAMNNSDYTTAEKYYNLVLKYDPDNEIALSALSNLTELKKVEKYESALREMARKIINDPAKYDFSDALILSDEFLNAVSELTQPVFFKEEDDQYIGVYPNGFIYYGGVEDSERHGHGIWYAGSIYSFLHVDCMWEDDLPNGEASIETFRNEAMIDKQPGYTYGIRTAYHTNVKDGLLEGNAEIIWEMDYGDPHEWHVVYKNGIMQCDSEGYGGKCIYCGATLSGDGVYVETIPGLF